LQGDDPEGKFGHLHSHRVDVHAVKAPVGDRTAGDCDPLIGVCRNQTLA
jgi:hypothetical protein